MRVPFANFMHSGDSNANYFWISPKSGVLGPVTRVETPPPHVAAIAVSGFVCVLPNPRHGVFWGGFGDLDACW